MATVITTVNIDRKVSSSKVLEKKGSVTCRKYMTSIATASPMFLRMESNVFSRDIVITVLAIPEHITSTVVMSQFSKNEPKEDTVGASTTQAISMDDTAQGPIS